MSFNQSLKRVEIENILTNEIESNTFDTKKGLYIIKCKDLVHKSKKYV